MGDLVEHGRSQQPGDPGTPATPPAALAAAPLTGPHLAALVGALGLAVGVAACAGGGNTTSGVASLNGAGKPTATTNAGGGRDDRQAAPNFARCTRQHGINLPDPQVTGDGIDQPPRPAWPGTTRGSGRRGGPAGSPCPDDKPGPQRGGAG